MNVNYDGGGSDARTEHTRRFTGRVVRQHVNPPVDPININSSVSRAISNPYDRLQACRTQVFIRNIFQVPTTLQSSKPLQRRIGFVEMKWRVLRSC
jgi:hypothetical protein